jgi:hypothetical protein
MDSKENIYKNFLKLLDKNHIYYSIDDDLLPNIETVVDEYITGGLGGRSCWDTEEYTIYGESPSYENIYKIFMLFFGDNDESYDKMVNTEHHLIGEKQVSDVPDYYGNYTDKCHLFLNLRDFFKILPVHILRKLIIEDVFENEI